MIGLGFYNVTQTTTDLNEVAFLRFTTEPDSETVNDGGSVTLTGIATAEFKHNPTTIPGERVTNTGDIQYQWYIEGIAAEDVTDKISGSTTNEITLSNLSNPTDTGKSVFLRATYAGSAYQSEGGLVTAGIAASTGNGVNQPRQLIPQQLPSLLIQLFLLIHNLRKQLLLKESMPHLL